MLMIHRYIFIEIELNYRTHCKSKEDSNYESNSISPFFHIDNKYYIFICSFKITSVYSLKIDIIVKQRYCILQVSIENKL